MRKFVSGSILAFAVASISAGAFAQGSGVTVTGSLGEAVSLSPTQAYRAFGDRIVAGRDTIGNNTLNWNQIDPALPATRIGLAINGAVDEATLLEVVRRGCMVSMPGSRGCAKVRLRGNLLGWGGFGYADARFDSTQVSLPEVVVAAPYIPPPAPAPVQKLDPITTSPLPPPAPVPTASVIVEPAAMVAAPDPEPMAPMSSEPVFATRLFAQREDYPPANFAAYGIVAFTALATTSDEARYRNICEAYFSALIDSGSSGAAVESQMVTVWPIIDDHPDGLIDTLNTQVREDGMCADAVKYYDLAIARIALRHAKMAGVELSGPGPFMLAWAPGTNKGRKNAAVLVADLGDVRSQADAREAMRIWREDIEGDPDFWKNGFSALKLRAKLRQLVNRYGNDLMKFVGAG